MHVIPMKAYSLFLDIAGISKGGSSVAGGSVKYMPEAFELGVVEQSFCFSVSNSGKGLDVTGYVGVAVRLILRAAEAASCDMVGLEVRFQGKLQLL